jgi:hypothetical protein
VANLREQTNDRRVSGSDCDKSARPLLILLGSDWRTQMAFGNLHLCLTIVTSQKQMYAQERLQPFGQSAEQRSTTAQGQTKTAAP